MEEDKAMTHQSITEAFSCQVSSKPWMKCMVDLHYSNLSHSYGTNETVTGCDGLCALALCAQIRLQKCPVGQKHGVITAKAHLKMSELSQIISVQDDISQRNG